MIIMIIIITMMIIMIMIDEGETDQNVMTRSIQKSAKVRPTGR